MDAEAFIKAHEHTMSFSGDSLDARKELTEECLKRLEQNLEKTRQLDDPTLATSPDILTSLTCLRFLFRDIKIANILLRHPPHLNTLFTYVTHSLTNFSQTSSCINTILGSVLCIYNLVLQNEKSNSIFDFTTLFTEASVLEFYDIATEHHQICQSDVPEALKLVKLSKILLVFVFGPLQGSSLASKVFPKINQLLRKSPFLEDDCKLLYAILNYQDPENFVKNLEVHKEIILLAEKHIRDFNGAATPLLYATCATKQGPKLDTIMYLCTLLDKPEKNRNFFSAIQVVHYYCCVDIEVRKVVRNYILPKRTREDIIQSPEDDDCIGAILIRQFSHVDDVIKDLCTNLIYTLCNRDKDLFIARTGFGNAAGYIFEQAFKKPTMFDKKFVKETCEQEKQVIHSNDQKHDHDKYGEYNLATGKFQKKIIPMENATDDEKEREARKLACLVQDLAKNGIIKPAGMDPSGGTEVLNPNPKVVYDSIRQMAGMKLSDESSDGSDSD